MAKLLQSRLPDVAKEYNQGQLNQIFRQIQIALTKDVELKDNSDEREAVNFFLMI